MIDYNRLAQSKSFYEKIGYKPIDVPWIADKTVIDITLPEESIPFFISPTQALVGSAEQSFLQLYAQGLLCDGLHQAITPCFRDDKEDFLHQKYFMKNELILTSRSVRMVIDDLERMIFDAKSFFLEYFDFVDVVKTQDGFDIEYKKVELGSYGIRNFMDLSWVYGTGCAEPRTTIALHL